MRPLLAIVVAATLGVACSSKPAEEAPRRTKEEQRKVDSTIGTLGLPGAGGVTKALAAQDSIAARNARMDSIAKAP